MEMIFCFCRKCLNELDRLYSETRDLPAFLYAYSDPKCAICDRKRKMAGTRKFEVDLMNVEEKDGVHQYTEFAVIQYIGEG